MTNVTTLVTLIGDEPRTTTLVIAEFTGNEHASVILLARKHRVDLEKFGRVRFEIAPFETEGGMQSREFALLNEPQSTLLMTYMRNTDRVRDLKIQLVAEFFRMREKLTAPAPASLALIPHEIAGRTMRVELDVALLLGAPLHMAQSEAVKATNRLTGISFEHMLRIAPAQDNIRDEDVMLEPTELGKQLGLSAIAMNQRLADLGLQAKINGAWAPTDAGEPHCSKHAWTKGQKSGVNLKWRARTVLKLHRSSTI